MNEEGVRPETSEGERVRAPFSFKLAIALTVLYLGWRLVEGIILLVEWIRG